MKAYCLVVITLLLSSCSLGPKPSPTKPQPTEPLQRNVLRESDLAQYKATIDQAEEMYQISMNTHIEVSRYTPTNTKWISKAKKQRSYITCLIGYKEIAEPFVKANTACKGQVKSEPIF